MEGAAPADLSLLTFTLPFFLPGLRTQSLESEPLSCNCEDKRHTLKMVEEEATRRLTCDHLLQPWAASFQVSCFMIKILPPPHLHHWLSHYGWLLVLAADGNPNWHKDQFLGLLLRQVLLDSPGALRSSHWAGSLLSPGAHIASPENQVHLSITHNEVQASGAGPVLLMQVPPCVSAEGLAGGFCIVRKKERRARVLGLVSKSWSCLCDTELPL